MNTENEFNTNAGTCPDGSTGDTCGENKETKKLDTQQTAVILAGVGINLDDLLIDNLGKALTAPGSSYKGNPNHLMLELDGADSKLRFTYEFLKKKLDIKIKAHTKAMDVAYDQKKVMYPEYGSLKYDGGLFYIKEIHADGHVFPISPSNDKNLAYKFFMYRLITGSKEYTCKDENGSKKTCEYKMAPTHVVTFKKDENTEYNNLDVLKEFKYRDTTTEKIETFLPGGRPNKNCGEILKQDKQALKDIIKDVFNEYNHHCRTLADVDELYKTQLIKTVCATAYDRTDQDYYIQYTSCHELFTMASMDEFCPKIEVQQPDWLDDL